MEEYVEKSALTSQQTERFRCSGDCLRCIPVQRQYCAAQHAYHSFRMLREMQEALEVLSDKINDLDKEIAAIQANEAMVFNPEPDSLEET